jgi:tetratricopeptide (TPR) repeat protein
LVSLLVAIFLVGGMVGCSKEAKMTRHKERANAYFEAGKYDEARLEYMNVLRLGFPDPLVMERLGKIWLEMGSPLQAAGYLAEARKLSSSTADVWAAQVRVLVSVGQFTEARREALAILAQFPTRGDALLILAETTRTPAEIEETKLKLGQWAGPQNAEYYMALAVLALKQQDLTGAADALGKAISAEPGSASAHFAMGRLHLLRKDNAKAREEFAKAAELAPPRSGERIGFAEFLARTREVQEAQRVLESVTKETPDYLPAWKALAQIALSEKRFADAHALLANVLSRDPSSYDGNLLDARAWLAEQQADKAIGSLKRLGGIYARAPEPRYELARAYLMKGEVPSAIGALEESISLNPDFVEAVLLLAELNLRVGNSQQVAVAMSVALRKWPDLAPARLMLAQAYQALGRSTDAVDVIQQQLAKTPDFAPAHLLLGKILRRQRQIDQARVALEKTIALAPNNSLGLRELVELEIGEKNFDVAFGRVRQEISRVPASAEARFLEALVQAAQGNWAEAEATLLKTLELDPNFGEAYGLLVNGYVATNRLPEALKKVGELIAVQPQNLQAQMVAGMIYERTGEREKAAAAYQRVITIDPNAYVALNNLACLSAQPPTDLEKAQEFARKARTLRPDDPSVADTLGWILFQRGEYAESLRLLEESAEKSPDHPEIAFHLGMANYMMGKKEDAMGALRRATASAADFTGKELALQRLKFLETGDETTLSVAELEGMLKETPTDSLVRIRLAERHEAQQEFAKAAAAYEVALRGNAKLPSVAIKLAEMYAGPLKAPEKALAYAKMARELAPNDPNALRALGRAAFENGKFRWGYNLLQPEHANSSTDAATLHTLAWCAYALGKMSEAEQLMNQIAERNRDSPAAVQARSFLAMSNAERVSRLPKETSVSTP